MSEERLQNILRLIESKQSISAKELEAQLYVSSATIRRDLAELARRGLIVRSHGKAMAVTRMAHAVACGSPELPGDPIGNTAAALIKPHSVVFIGAGRCCLPLAKAASRIPDLTVVTDSISAANILCGHAAHLYCTGGQAAAGRDSLSGSQAAELAGLFYYSIAFFSCNSLAGSGSIAFNELERMPVLRTAARQAEKRVLLFFRRADAGQAGQRPAAAERHGLHCHRCSRAFRLRLPRRSDRHRRLISKRRTA